MKRILLLAAAVGAAITMTAAPVFADTADPGSDTNLVVATERGITRVVNPIVGAVPAPDNWHDRFFCAWNYQTDQQVCLYFPFPT
jgi:hypothetical protein